MRWYSPAKAEKVCDGNGVSAEYILKIAFSCQRKNIVAPFSTHSNAVYIVHCHSFITAVVLEVMRTMVFYKKNM